MQVSQLPVKFTVPFANGAGPSFIQYPIPASSQIGITGGAASFTDGFPPLNFSPISSGGIPPRGVDFNGILYQITAWNQWQQVGGSIPYDSTFQAAIGGYPSGAVVESVVCPGNYWQSTADNNVTNPDAFGAGWRTPPWAKGTGDWAWRPSSAALANHIVMNGTTIGSAASGASQLASATTLFVYKYLWDTFSNTQCPVSGGRGASASADFAANKTIGTFNMQATGIAGVDGMGGTPTSLYTGVPIVSGSATAAGSILGENLHTLVTSEIAAHQHAVFLKDGQHSHGIGAGAGVINYTGASAGGGGTLAGTTASTTTANASSNITIGSVNGVANDNQTAGAGGGNSHNNVSRIALGYWFMHI